MDKKIDNMDVCYNLLERQACDYPDGFLEFSVTHNTREPQSLLVQMDSPETNTHYSISIQLINDSTMAFSSELYAQYDNIRLSVMAEEYDYDDWYVWRNQEVADIRAGKYIPVSDGEQPDENSPFGAMAIKMDSRLALLTCFFSAASPEDTGSPRYKWNIVPPVYLRCNSS